MDGGNTRYYDKVECKFANYNEDDFAKAGVRVVPNAVARRGSYIAPGAILMPSYVNIGAYVDSGTMVDTWVTVAPARRSARTCIFSGGVGIGGVLEPLQAGPTIIGRQLFHRRAFRNRRRRDRRRRLRDFDGSLYRPKHQKSITA